MQKNSFNGVLFCKIKKRLLGYFRVNDSIKNFKSRSLEGLINSLNRKYYEGFEGEPELVLVNEEKNLLYGMGILKLY